jgi:RIO-like serine/threonine protein kinase
MMSPTSDESQPTADHPAEALPEKIGRYRIIERLGEGGMGVVYKGHDPQLDRVVVVKLPRFDGPPETLSRRVQRFQREARAAAQIWHPHVCPIYDVGEHEGRPYVIMAYVEGQSLAERLRGQGRYEDIGQALTVILQILDALKAVHARGIIHRDLKPGNILIDSAGRAILTDFGLARPENDAEHLTSEGAIVGTPAYMAPEQAGGQLEKIGPWTDLYSAAVVLYQMLTGRVPFEGGVLAVLNKIAQEPPPPPSRFRSDLDPALEAILLKALAKEFTERYPDAVAFMEALSHWVPRGQKPTPPRAGLNASQRSAKKSSLTATMVRERPRRSASLILRRVAALLGVVVGIFFLLNGLLLASSGDLLLPLRKADHWKVPEMFMWGAAVYVVSAVVFSLLPLAAVGFRQLPLWERRLVAGLSWLVAAGVLVATAIVLASPWSMCFSVPAVWAGIVSLVSLRLALRRLFYTESGLLAASAFGQEEHLLEILGHGVAVDCKDAMGETPLMKAARHGHLRIVKHLILNRAQVNEKDHFGQTALTMARLKRHQEVLELLTKAGAKE